MLRKKIRWFSYGQRFYFALGICPEHGYMKGKIRVKKSERDLYYAVKTIKAVGEDALPMLVQKREDNKKKKKKTQSIRTLIVSDAGSGCHCLHRVPRSL